ncbi:glycosyltransferase family 10 [Moritella sp.]|uniref:glycosyltransferase family 10 domain-containing protein n=1 Tax=Moritella sp. TaxID=78556 RepID=UPI001DD75AA1|nr:glycosyltransferase family 10 [Moritella sp.]MCJ8347966.1 glycosyltransferase family 10 [Moritella sp.]NQZ40361.1 hypothetical protein [Moritella sp.]
MLKASLVVDYYLQNKMFDLDNEYINRDDCLYSSWLLKKKLNEINVDLSTCDINDPSRSKFAIYFDLPVKGVKITSDFSYLFLFESAVIKSFSWELKQHEQFTKIFTWNDDLVDNKKYFKMNFSHKFPDNINIYKTGILPFEDKTLCTLISGNKVVNHKMELYSKRVKTIRWFEKNAPHDFEFYGVGWEIRVSANRYLNYFLARTPLLSKKLAVKHPSYKGMVDSKRDTLHNYKFSICYENAQMISGYITEKVFDCFFAGCVPIYWGAPNITEHIPENCFIDRRQFKTHEELYLYLKNMTKEQYVDIQNNISDYLFSDKSKPYRAETFANMIVEHVLDDLNRH